MIRRRYVLTAFLLTIGVLTATADSLILAVDLSYSLQLPAPGNGSRGEYLLRETLACLAEQPSDTEYALVTSEHAQITDVSLGYPTSRATLAATLPTLIPFGTTDLRPLVSAALAVARTSGDGTGLLLVTDAEDDHLPDSRLRALVLDSGVPLSVILYDSGLPSCHASTLASLAVESGGSYRVVGPGSMANGALAEEADRAVSMRTDQRPADVLSGPAASSPEPADSSSASGLLRLIHSWLNVARWLFIAAAAAALLVALRLAARWRRRVRRVVEYNERPPTMEILVRGPDGDATHTITSYPARIGGAGSDVPLLHTGHPPVLISHAEDGFSISSSSPIRVNGMTRAETALREGALIRVDEYRVQIRSIRPIKTVRPPRRNHRQAFIAPGIAGAAAIIAFLVGPLFAETPDVRPTSDGPSAARPVSPSDGDRSAGSSGSSPELVTADLTSAYPTYGRPEVASPGNLPAPFDADYVAIHAHPDDESLDFGLALSRLSRAGLHGVLILLTDGNAGIDQYPFRIVAREYPDFDLEGDQLATVRVDEVRRALGHLGVETYVRLGLQNHPYNSVTDEISVRQLLSEWDGDGHIVHTLASLLEAYQPELVLSPDGPAATYEHFEHEATGLLTAAAIAEAVSRPESSIRAYLTSVDPLQTDRYDNLIELPAWGPTIDPLGEDRQRQLDALTEHQTQRDASTIGVEVRRGVPDEYYTLAWGSLDTELLRILGVRQLTTD